MLQEVVPLPCTCGLLYGGCGAGECYGGGGAASLLLPMEAHCGDAGAGKLGDGGERPAVAPVDCTLSLATPSTRRAEAVGVAERLDAPPAAGKPECEEAAAGRRRCANCDTRSTPLWRNGPRGPKSLCNACGIRYKKEERRAAAAIMAPAAVAPPLDSGLCYGYGYGYGRTLPPPPPPLPAQWGCYGHAGAAKSASFPSMFGGGVDAADDVPCLSWRFSMMPASSPAFAVRESPSKFHYY